MEVRDSRHLPTKHPNARIIRHLHQVDSLQPRVTISLLVLDRNIDKHDQREKAPESRCLNNGDYPIRNPTAPKKSDFIQSDELPD